MYTFWVLKVGNTVTKKKYTALVRKCDSDYLAICLELNICAQGSDLVDVQRSIIDATEVYLEEIHEYPETIVRSVTTEELIEFLHETAPESVQEKDELTVFNYEVKETPVHV